MPPCTQSIDLDSRLAGSVKPYNWWYLIEYSDPDAHDWTSHAVDDALKEGALADNLTHLMRLKPRARILFIRQRERDRVTHKRVYLCDSQAQRLYSAEIDSYDALRQIGFARDVPLIGGEPLPASADDLYLVCTNGNRDCRCWDFGQPVYQALRQIVGDRVWETTHIGGHKYAATLYVYPQAICYGRLSVDDVPALVQAQQDDVLLLNNYRGRSHYTQPVQAAEHHLRSQHDRTGMDDFVLIGTQAQGDQTIVWAQFQGDTAQVHRVQIAADERGFYVAQHDCFAKQA